MQELESRSFRMIRMLHAGFRGESLREPFFFFPRQGVAP